MEANRYKICVLFCFSLLQGCASLNPLAKKEPIANVDQVWQQRQIKLNTISAWALKGRLAVKTDKDAWSASLQWAQKDEQYRMRIIAPLGQGTYQIRRGEDKVSLLTAENELFEADDVETLMLDNVGWSVPIEGLRYWMRGVPEPGSEVDSIQLNDKGFITELSQSGWSIDFSRYKKADDYFLPGKVVLENERIKLTVLAKKWLEIR